MLYLDQLRIWKFIENSVLQDEKKSGQFSGQFWRIIYRLSQALVVVLAQKFVGKHKRRCSTWIRRVFGNSSKTPPYKIKSFYSHFYSHLKIPFPIFFATMQRPPPKHVGNRYLGPEDHFPTPHSSPFPQLRKIENLTKN